MSTGIPPVPPPTPGHDPRFEQVRQVIDTLVAETAKVYVGQTSFVRLTLAASLRKSALVQAR